MAEERTTCPRCGAEVFVTDNVCLHCGAELRTEEGPAAEIERSPLAPEQPWPAERSPLAPQPPGEPRPAPGPATGYLARPGAFAPDVTTYRGGGGLLEGIARAWRFFVQSISMCFRDKDLILPSLFAMATNLVIVGLALGVILLVPSLRHWFLEESATKETVEKYIVTGMGLVVTFCVLLVNYFFAAMTVNMVDVFLSGRDATLGEAWRDARKNFWAIFSLAVVSLIVRLAIGALRSRRGRGLGDIAADALDRIWTVATYLILPIIILEDTSLGNAVKRATQLHRRSIVGVVVGEVAVGLLGGLLTFVVALGAVAVGYLLFQIGGIAGLVLAVAGGGTAFITATAFTTYVRTAFYTCLYLWAAAQETVGEFAPAPAPLAPAVA